MNSWPAARVEVRVWGALLGQNPANQVNPLNRLSVPECVFWSNTPIYVADFVEIDTSVQCFVFTFSWTSQLRHLLLRAFLEDCLPEMLSTVGVLAGRSIKQSKASSDSSSGLGRQW